MPLSGRDPARTKAKLRGLLLLLAPDGRCACCRRKRPLEVDHVDGVTWRQRRLNFRNRVDRFVREFQAGVRLRALCRECNGRDGAQRERRYA
jgi:hypothetical protein